MKRNYTPLIFGIIALVIIVILFLLSMVVRSMDPEDQHWYWNSPLLIWFCIFPIYMPFAAVGIVRSVKRIRYKEERKMAITSAAIAASAVLLGAILVISFVMCYQNWPRFWITH